VAPILNRIISHLPVLIGHHYRRYFQIEKEGGKIYEEFKEQYKLNESEVILHAG
jgi:hypothetical protein